MLSNTIDHIRNRTLHRRSPVTLRNSAGCNRDGAIKMELLLHEELSLRLSNSAAERNQDSILSITDSAAI